MVLYCKKSTLLKELNVAIIPLILFQSQAIVIQSYLSILFLPIKYQITDSRSRNLICSSLFIMFSTSFVLCFPLRYYKKCENEYVMGIRILTYYSHVMGNAFLTYYSYVPIPMITYCKTYRLWEGLWLQSLQLWTVLQFPCWLIDWKYFLHINTDTNITWFKLEIIRCRYHICHILKSKLNVFPITELICSVLSPYTWIGFEDLVNVKNECILSKSNPLVLSMHLKIFATKIDRLKYHFVIFEVLLSTMINFLSSYLVVSIYNSPLYYMHLNRIEYLSKTYLIKWHNNVSTNVFTFVKIDKIIVLIIPIMKFLAHI